MNLPQVLQDAGNLITPHLRAAIGGLSPSLRRVVDYHMGWADAEGRVIQARGSRSIRPALAILGARVAGAEDRVAIPGAIAVELLNNFSFLHDDVMDGDRQRRDRPTAWVTFGVPQAVCTGDALLVLAIQTLAEWPTMGAQVALRSFLDTTSRMIAGQMRDLTLTATDRPSIADWSDMNRMKTGALVSCAASIGALLSDAPSNISEGLAAFGESVGLAFQAFDDFLGVFGVPSETGGRPVGFDIRARKPSLPLVLGLSDETVAEKIGTYLVQPDLGGADVHDVQELLTARAVPRRVEAIVSSYLEEAQRHLAKTGIVGELRDLYGEIATAALRR